MNALATDQASRLAETVFRNPELRGRVSAGLYIGEEDRVPSVTMTESRLITSREAMRQSPPDILLTNYKMLDLLLLRPKDLPLGERTDPRHCAIWLWMNSTVLTERQGAELHA